MASYATRKMWCAVTVVTVRIAFECVQTLAATAMSCPRESDGPESTTDRPTFGASEPEIRADSEVADKCV